MSTYTKVKFSSSTDGMGIKITQTATAGDTIHTADATALDEIWCWVVNTSGSAVKITFEYGTATAADGNIEMTIPAESGAFRVIPGFLLTNSKVLKAFAASANVLLVFGYVNRIS